MGRSPHLRKKWRISRSAAEAIRQPRDRLKRQPQERQHSAAGFGGTRDRLPPARGDEPLASWDRSPSGPKPPLGGFGSREPGPKGGRQNSTAIYDRLANTPFPFDGADARPFTSSTAITASPSRLTARPPLLDSRMARRASRRRKALKPLPRAHCKIPVPQAQTIGATFAGSPAPVWSDMARSKGLKLTGRVHPGRDA
jgi:hypothetical protein